MPKIEGVNAVRRVLAKLMRIARREDKVSVVVGYTTNYAVYVHETHKTKPKFLETPAREMQRKLATIVRTTRRHGGTLEDGLLLAGHALQRASQKLVPVDTGNLKGSAFTEVEK